MSSIHDKGVAAIGMDEDGSYALNDNPASKELLEKVRDAQFTPEQIKEFCDELAPLAILFPTSTANKTVRIIRQLQNQARGCKLWVAVV